MIGKQDMHIRIFVILLFTFLFFYTCKSEIKKSQHQKELDVLIDLPDSLNNKEVTVLLDLPDSLYVNDTLKGAVFYKSSFDTIKLSVNENRYVFLYLNKTKKPSKNLKDFLTRDRDTFVTIEDGINIIPVFDIKFSTIGDYYLDGYIIDELWLNKNSDKDGIKIPTYKTKITHKIRVIK